MKGLVAMLALLLAIATPALAGQDVASQEQIERVQQRLQQIKERLALTPEQIEQLRPVLMDEGQKLRALREKYSEGVQNRRARRNMGKELREIQASADDQLTQILSKSQMEEMKKIREEWRQQLRNRAAAR